MSEPMRKILYYENVLEFKENSKSTLEWCEVNNWCLCRICLSDAADCFSDFNVMTMDGTLMNMQDMTMEVTGQKILPEDRLPEKVCKECLTKITSMYFFKLQSKRAEQVLNGLLKKLDCVDIIDTCIPKKSDEMKYEVHNTMKDVDCSFNNEDIEVIMQDGNVDFDVIKCCDVIHNASPKSFMKNEEQNRLIKEERLFDEQDDISKDYIQIDEIPYSELDEEHAPEEDEITSIPCEGELFGDNESEFIEIINENDERNQQQSIDYVELHKSEEDVLMLFNIENVEVLVVKDKENINNAQNLLQEHIPADKKSTKIKSNGKGSRLGRPLLENLTCAICEKEFQMQRELVIHVQKEHPFEKAFKCRECNSMFTHVQSLSRHMQSHNLVEYKNICDYCGKGFMRCDDWKRHIRVHTNERPYVCYCRKGFKQSSELREHQLSHIKNKVFKCDICGHSLSSRNGLYIHKKTHQGIKNFICIQCEKAFMTSGELKSHMKVHLKKPRVEE